MANAFHKIDKLQNQINNLNDLMVNNYYNCQRLSNFVNVIQNTLIEKGCYTLEDFREQTKTYEEILKKRNKNDQD